MNILINLIKIPGHNKLEMTDELEKNARTTTTIMRARAHMTAITYIYTRRI